MVPRIQCGSQLMSQSGGDVEGCDIDRSGLYVGLCVGL